MPAYNFQGQFVPYIEDESKPHTVRADRKDGKVPNPGDTLYLYTGMRTKKCRKIGEAICIHTSQIRITETGIAFGGYLILADKTVLQQPPSWLLNDIKRDIFAWKDGFRPEGSTIDNPHGSWELMLQFFKHTHELPFQGVVIYWKDFKAAK